MFKTFVLTGCHSLKYIYPFSSYSLSSHAPKNMKQTLLWHIVIKLASDRKTHACVCKRVGEQENDYGHIVRFYQVIALVLRRGKAKYT